MMFRPGGQPGPGRLRPDRPPGSRSRINSAVDTADVYGPGGESGRIVSKALKGRRDDVVLATKVNGSMGEDPNRAGSPRRWIVAEVEDSLRRTCDSWGTK